MKINLSPEAAGVLGALSLLGSVRSVDAAGLELVPWGFAVLDGKRLVLTNVGADYAKAMRKRATKGLRKEWTRPDRRPARTTRKTDG